MSFSSTAIKLHLMTLRLTIILSILTLITNVSRSQTKSYVQVDSSKSGYYIGFIDASVGYYQIWDYPDYERILNNLRIYALNEHSPIATAFRIGFARTTKRELLTWGLSYYRSSSSRRYDTDFNIRDTDILNVRLDGIELTDVNNYFNIFVEPMLIKKGKLSLSGHVSIGLAYLEDDNFDIPVDGGPIVLTTSRSDNAGFMELHNAVGFTGRYQPNPFYRVYASMRYNWLVSAQTGELAELAVGLELILRKGGLTIK